MSVSRTKCTATQMQASIIRRETKSREMTEKHPLLMGRGFISRLDVMKARRY